MVCDSYLILGLMWSVLCGVWVKGGLVSDELFDPDKIYCDEFADNTCK